MFKTTALLHSGIAQGHGILFLLERLTLLGASWDYRTCGATGSVSSTSTDSIRGSLTASWVCSTGCPINGSVTGGVSGVT